MTAENPYDKVWKDNEERYASAIPVCMDALVKTNKNLVMLELGSGDGRVAFEMAKVGHDVATLEISEAGNQKSKERAENGKVKLQVITGEIFSALQYPDQHFNLVFSLQALNHNTKEKIQRAFQEVYRVLKPGGTFILKIANWDTFDLKKVQDDIYVDNLSGDHIKMVSSQTYIPVSGYEKGITHYAFLEDELRQAIEETGFSIKRLDKDGWHFTVEANR
tara:strand:+ start:4577 stop:5236 length:660 start_codon:yes stop_codon:yes gene_type:complete